MRGAARPARHPWWRGFIITGVLLAVIGGPRAQTAAPAAAGGDDGLVLAADQALGAAMRSGDRSAARKILSLQFSFVDENGRLFERRDFLAGLKELAAAPASDVKVKIYGRIGVVTGHRQSVLGHDVFFLDIWARQKGAWRALIAQDVTLAAASAPPAAGPAATPYECKNPCETIPYRVRSPAEQDVINSFQAVENASVEHDADEWAKHIADEFTLYGSGRAPIAKADRIAAIKRQKEDNIVVRVGEIETMQLVVYDDGAAMIATHMVPGNARPPYRAARVWVKRNGEWQLAISVQTDVAAAETK